MASLDLRLEEPGDDHLADEMFPIIKDALESGTGSALHLASQRISDLLPKDDPDSNEAHNFCDLCIVLAMQIPYDHAKMIDVVTLVQLVLDSSRISASEKEAIAKTRKWPYRAMVLPLADEDSSWSAPIKEEDRAKFVSFHAFEALLYKRCIVDGATLPLELLREALEGGNGLRKPRDFLTQDIQAMAATQVILIFGHEILFKLLNDPTSDLGHWFAGPLYGAGRDPYSVDRWHYWQDTFRAIAAGKWDESEKLCVSGETKQLATRAANTMDATEKDVGMSRRPPETDKTTNVKHSDKSFGRKIREWFK